MTDLFTPLAVGTMELRNRIIMAPLTRGRAGDAGIPNAMMVQYYADRADAGLIISEATGISRQGHGWIGAPGIWTAQQVEGWKPVTSAVHAKSGKMFLQLWHMGRLVHPDLLDGEPPVSSSPVKAAGEARTPGNVKSYETPRALAVDELDGIVADYGTAAKNALAAGFDGVEIHAANGYLLDEFIRDGVNKREDEYGGSIENRWRFPLMVVDAVVAAVGAERTGIRFSPTSPSQDMSDSEPEKTFYYGASEMNKRKLAYVSYHRRGEGAFHGWERADSRRVQEGV